MNWPELKEYASQNPSFCFVPFIYSDRSWIPSQLEYGALPLPPQPFRLFGNTFRN